MGRIALGALALALAGCASGGSDGGLPPNYYVADKPYASEALAALPADIPYSDLLVYTEPEDIGFCYHYRSDGKIYPLTNADGYPVCVQ
ncbi:hypothetical protein [Maritimibacter sp. UBA3975]|uniref:hypothetical protein n=1 Tax=Maritimibacter sp. UBA3975 TaxID=1946833 RepID=UPI000C091E83|nr:hypothetical protein [Maritimibacter sp. UBA3975]MAM63274.1 hypothetical protein [Maritimibacter sp.]|tara:strand:- start:69278 stop:69544 length:267 start_codon:yes stop_codon:yes gene_type:complete